MTSTLLEMTEQTRNDFLSGLPTDQQTIVVQAFKDLLASTVAATAMNVGDKAPEFCLPNVKGGSASLFEALQQGPVVLSFYRGSWCPFCNLELNALQAKLPELKALGASLIAISPEKPDASLSHREKLNLDFDVLSDRGNRIANTYGLLMEVAESMRPLYLQWGINVPEANGDGSYELPVPATYVIASSGTIVAAYVDKDYTKRMEPEDIVTALKSL